MTNTWYLIANSAEARIYALDDISDELNLSETLTHPESRMKGSEISSDRPGHYQASGEGHGAFSESTNPKEYEAERFAMEVSHYLDQSRNDNKFKELVVAASPHFHGLLNKFMNKHVAEMVSTHIQKDLSHVKETDLKSALSNYQH